MTQREIFHAATKSKYLLMRHKQGYFFGVNSRIIFKLLNENKYTPDKETQYVSATPISFQEYIENKLPFITE